MTTKKKTISIEKAMPDFRRFAATKSEARSILQNVKLGDKYAYATDSHVLIRMNKDALELGDIGDSDLINTRTGEMTKDVDAVNPYPSSIDRLIPEESNTRLSINKSDIKTFRNAVDEALEFIEQDERGLYPLDIVITAGEASFYALNEQAEVFSRKINADVSGEDLTISLDARKLKSLLVTVNKFRRLSDDNEPISMEFTGKLRPIKISDSAAYDIVLMPIRTVK